MPSARRPGAARWERAKDSNLPDAGYEPGRLPEARSARGEARTRNLPVRSRPLHQLSYTREPEPSRDDDPLCSSRSRRVRKARHFAARTTAGSKRRAGPAMARRGQRRVSRSPTTDGVDPGAPAGRSALLRRLSWRRRPAIRRCSQLARTADSSPGLPTPRTSLRGACEAKGVLSCGSSTYTTSCEGGERPWRAGSPGLPHGR